MKKSMTILCLLIFVLTITACSGSNLDGTWVRVAGETGGFASITFDGDSIAIPTVTDIFGAGAGAMGIRYVYTITDGYLVISTSTQGVTMEAARFSFRQDGNSIFVGGVEYVR